jgi:predicted Zn-dependent peptidase
VEYFTDSGKIQIMSFTKTTLKNGLRIITVPMKDNSTVTVMSLVEAGSNYETKDINGISHFLEHMCFKGTEKRPSSSVINVELDSLGSQSNAFTGNEYTGYWAKAHHSKTEKLLDIVSDIYLNSKFPADELEKEKGVIIEEINMYEDLPRMKVGEIFEELLYGDQPAGRPIIGPKENIKKMTRDDFVKYHKDHYVAKATTVVVAGKMNEKKVIEQIKKLFEKVSNGKKGKIEKVVEIQKAPQAKIFFKETDQTHLIIGFRAFDRYDKRNTALSLLSTVLGGGMSSRLFQKMREELGICYYVRSGKNSYVTHGNFVISAGVSNTRVNEAIVGILEEVKKISLEIIPEIELRKAKDYLTGTMFLGLESSDSLADFYGFQELLHDKKIQTPDDLVKKIEKITAKEIQKVAKEILKNEGLNLAMVGPFKDEKEFVRLLKI